MDQRPGGEAADEDHRHDRVPLAAAIEFVVGAFRSGGDQRRPIRPNVAQHASIVAPERHLLACPHLHRKGHDDPLSVVTGSPAEP